MLGAISSYYILEKEKFIYHSTKLLFSQITNVELFSVLGTGSVGVELVKYGFKNITATDYCQEMLDAAKEKGTIKFPV